MRWCQFTIRNISPNVQEASTGTEEVASNAEGLNIASRETGAAASRVLDV